jgi:hypothetical protein
LAVKSAENAISRAQIVNKLIINKRLYKAQAKICVSQGNFTKNTYVSRKQAEVDRAFHVKQFAVIKRYNLDKYWRFNSERRLRGEFGGKFCSFFV